MAIFDQDAEQMDREELAQMQLERLQATLTRVYKNVKFYKKKFDELGFLPEDCQSLEDLARLPFTTRHDLARAYPYEMFAVPLREVVRIHSSTGSPGNPIVMGYTSRDLRHWAKLAARVLTAAGVDRDDVVQVTLSYGLLTSAFGLHYGVELLGASVIPTGPGFTARQVQVMRDYRTTVLVSTPSYALVLADQMEAHGGGPQEPPPQAGPVGRGALDRGHAGRNRSPPLPAPPWTTTPCPRPWGRGWPGSAPRTRWPACTSTRTISCPRSSTRRPARSCPPASWGSWSSPPSPGRPPPWCASAPAIWCACSTSPAPAAGPWPA